jgi:hypothetical protein
MKENKSLKCKVRGCENPYCSKSTRLCPSHLMRLRRTGKTGSGKIRDYGLNKKDDSNEL